MDLIANFPKFQSMRVQDTCFQIRCLRKCLLLPFTFTVLWNLQSWWFESWWFSQAPERSAERYILNKLSWADESVTLSSHAVIDIRQYVCTHSRKLLLYLQQQGTILLELNLVPKTEKKKKKIQNRSEEISFRHLLLLEVLASFAIPC